jgi:hypothetical protein
MRKTTGDAQPNDQNVLNQSRDEISFQKYHGDHLTYKTAHLKFALRGWSAGDGLENFPDRCKLSWAGEMPAQDDCSTNEDPNFRFVSGMGSCI